MSQAKGNLIMITDQCGLEVVFHNTTAYTILDYIITLTSKLHFIRLFDRK